MPTSVLLMATALFRRVVQRDGADQARHVLQPAAPGEEGAPARRRGPRDGSCAIRVPRTTTSPPVGRITMPPRLSALLPENIGSTSSSGAPPSQLAVSGRQDAKVDAVAVLVAAGRPGDVGVPVVGRIGDERRFSIVWRVERDRPGCRRRRRKHAGPDRCAAGERQPPARRPAPCDGGSSASLSFLVQACAAANGCETCVLHLVVSTRRPDRRCVCESSWPLGRQRRLVAVWRSVPLCLSDAGSQRGLEVRLRDRPDARGGRTRLRGSARSRCAPRCHPRPR